MNDNDFPFMIHKQLLLFSLFGFSVTCFSQLSTLPAMQGLDSIVIGSTAPLNKTNDVFEFYANGIQMEPVTVSLCFRAGTKPESSAIKNIWFHVSNYDNYAITPDAISFNGDNGAPHIYAFSSDSRYFHVEKALGLHLGGGIYNPGSPVVELMQQKYGYSSQSICGNNSDVLLQKTYYLVATNPEGINTRTVSLLVEANSMDAQGNQVVDSSNSLSFKLDPPLKYPDNSDGSWRKA